MNTLMRRYFDNDLLLDRPPGFWNDDDRSAFRPVNIRDAGKTYEVELAVPGYRKEDLQVDLDQGVLTVSCDRKDERSGQEDGYTRHEFSSSSFRRSFQLPEAADEESLKARYEHGVLSISIGKRKEAQAKLPRTINID